MQILPDSSLVPLLPVILTLRISILVQLAALGLMTRRRCITLIELFAGSGLPLKLHNELLLLAISVLWLAGISQ